jgi:hypothetical protein
MLMGMGLGRLNPAGLRPLPSLSANYSEEKPGVPE